MAEKTYLQAISDGLREEMRRDKRVFVIGEDVGVYGGAFKVTLGFQEEFGPWRVIDAPLSETAIVGGCTGAAIMGMRPVAEMQFADFISCAWDHLVTVAAKQRWRAGTPVPITVRLPSGGGFSGGPFHSQNPESSFAHIPGLKCVCPATPEDAKGLMISAIEDPNPVLFFEHKHLYRRIKGEVPDERYTTPNRLEFAIEHLAERAAAYGFEGVVVDGTDVLAVYREARHAIEKAREGGGPTLIECVTLRMEGHAVHDDAFYVPREMFEEWAKRDPIERFRAWLRDNASLSDEEEDEITGGVKRVLNDAVQRAEESPWPDPDTLTEGVFATPEELDTPHHK